jgi:ATP synthase protein I
MKTQRPSTPRAAVLSVAVVTVVVAVVFAFVDGVEGVVGAVLGGLLVIGFFGVDHAVDARLRQSDPRLVMAVVLGGYVAKVCVLAALLVLLHDTTLFSVTAFGVTALVSTVVWLVADVRSFTRRRILYVEPDQAHEERAT